MMAFNRLNSYDKHLKGEDSGLLNGPSSEYPEVEIKVK